MSSSLSLARRFIQKRNLKGEVVLNYSVHNLFSLIQELLIQVDPKDRLISNDESAYIFYKLIYKNDYGLKEHVKSFGAANKLLEVINDYRLNDNDIFSSLTKADYKTLLSDYEAYLSNISLVDYVISLKKISSISRSESIYLLSDISLRPLEKNVLNQIFSNRIYQVEDEPHELTIDNIYEVYGQYGEVLNVLNYIEENNIPVGDVEVLYTDSVFENLIKGTCDSRKIPYTLKTNHAKMTNIVSFINDTLDYIKSDYQYELLEKVLSNQGLNPLYLKEFYQTISFPKYIVGYSLERSKEFLNVYKGEKKIKNFYELFESIFRVVDNNFLDYEVLLKVAVTYLSANKEIEVLSSKLEELNHIFLHEDDFNKKIDIIQKELESLSYSEKDMKGYLSFSPISRSFTLKPYIFVIGMNQNLLVGDDVENAFIDDLDKFENDLRDDKNIHLSKFQKKKKLENLKYYLSHSDSRIILSYSSDDKINLKDMTEGVYLLDYSKPLPEVNKVNAYQIQKDNLKFPSTKNKEILEEVEQDYDNGEFKEVEEKETKDSYEEIQKEEPVEHIEEAKPFTLSPSAVKNLLECPFTFYYSKVLNIISVQFPELNESVWLEANSKGTLFHRVMQLYFNRYINKKIDFNLEIFEKCFNKAKEEALKLNPINNEYITEKEIEDLHKAANDYLIEVINSNQFALYRVLANEFDLKEYHLSYGKKCENLFFSGEVDRVDGYVHEGVLHLRVVDYKTGKYHEKGKSGYYQHVLYSYILESILLDNNPFNLEYDKVVVDSFIYDYPFDESKRKNEYPREEFDSDSTDYKDVFAAIDMFVVPFLKNDKNYIQKMMRYFNDNYIEASEREANTCQYCRYHKECIMRVKGGYKSWKEKE